MAQPTLNQIIAAAIQDIDENGYHSPEQIQGWMDAVKAAISREYPAHRSDEQLRRTLNAVYAKQITNGSLARFMKLEPWKIHNLAPKLRVELDRRIMASAQLIRLNREEMTARTLRRFAGWAMSAPVGGAEVNKRETKAEVVKSLKQLPFTERRVMIDQAAKLKASLSEIVAVNNGAIFAYWKSQWRMAGYDYDKAHKELDDKIFVVRDNWAMQNGLIKLDGAQYTDEVEQAPAQRPYCGCYWSFRFSLRDIPDNMLTEKGLNLKKGKT